MQDWLKVTLLLCAFGVLREIRPSEPYVTEFLLGEWRNITVDQLYQEVYPVGTYSYFAQLVLVFLLTDFLRFKPVIILSGTCGIIVYATLLWTKSLEWLQVNQFFYGLYMATEVAYLTYIYAKVDSDKYPQVSSYTRMAALTGRFLSGTSAQLLTYFSIMNYRQLNYITFSSQILATFWALWLPSVKYSVYFHRKEGTVGIRIDSIGNSQKKVDHPNKQDKEANCSSNFIEATTLIYRHAKTAYSRPKVIIWSLFYAAALCLFVQAQTYVQVLWRDINNESEDSSSSDTALNGAAEAALTLLGGGGALLASILGPNFIAGPAALLQGAALFAASYPNNIYLSYLGYIVMGVLFHYTITLASAKIASQLSDESCFGLIFGINTLLGTGLQSLLTYVMINALGLSIKTQFYTISTGYILLAAIWFCGWVFYSSRSRANVKNISQSLTMTTSL